MGRYLTLGFAVYVFLLLVNFPAELAGHWFLPDDVELHQVEGRVWSGQAQAITTPQLTLDETEWTLSAWRLMTGRASADVKTRLGNSRLNATVAKSLFGDTLTLTSVQGVVDLENLPPGTLQQPVTGRAGIDFSQLTLDALWPSAAQGSVDVIDLGLTVPRKVALGNFEVVFATPSDDGVVTGAVGDVDSPLVLTATLTLTPERNYRLEGTARASAGADPEIAAALQFLGPPAPDGGVQISFEGRIDP